LKAFKSMGTLTTNLLCFVFFKLPPHYVQHNSSNNPVSPTTAGNHHPIFLLSQNTEINLQRFNTLTMDFAASVTSPWKKNNPHIPEYNPRAGDHLLSIDPAQVLQFRQPAYYPLSSRFTHGLPYSATFCSMSCNSPGTFPFKHSLFPGSRHYFHHIPSLGADPQAIGTGRTHPQITWVNRSIPVCSFLKIFRGPVTAHIITWDKPPYTGRIGNTN
jgi:hypothetical protein